MTTTTRRQRPRLPWARLAVPAAAGVPTGMLWWLLAPGGLNLATRDPALGAGTNPLVWLPRDLTLAGLLVFAGCLLGVFLTGQRRRDPQLDLLLGLAGALCGAVIAWQTGLLAAHLWGPRVDASANASTAFSLRSLPVLLLWPAATAVSVFVLELMHLLGRKADGGADSSLGDAVPVK